MCGIAGIVNPSGINTAVLQQFSAVLQHRGPDDEGYAVIGDTLQLCKGNDTISELSALPSITTAKGTVGLVHRRLSIIDLSPAGHQPMAIGDHRYTIVYNGEVYNYKEIKKELEAKGHAFQSHTDTEVILKAYSEWGGNCVQHFIGMWAFAIYDQERHELFLSRDRFGIKPLYYTMQEGQLAFASEIKALLKAGVATAEVAASDLVEYLSFGTQSQPHTNLFHHIHDLPPGHNAIYLCSNGSWQVNAYYDFAAAVAQRKIDDPLQQFKTAFEASIQLHLRSDVPVGSCLSGGLDSSAIVALAAQATSQPFHTFTAAYKEKDIDESGYAKLVAEQFSNVQSHYTYPTAQGFLNDIDQLIYTQDLPIGSTSIFAQWEVMKLAGKQGIKVLLDGQGADEALGGYYNFAGLFLLEELRAFRWGNYRRELKALKQHFTPNMKSALARAFYYYLPAFMQRKLRAKERLGMHFIAPKYQHLLQQIAIPQRGGKTYREHAILSLQFGLYDLLRYEDRNAMAFSIESRVPFLDHRLVELSVALPNKAKINNGWTKYVLRKMNEPLLPAEVVWRKDKMGFITPQKQWKKEVMPQMAEYLQQCAVPELMDKNYLLELSKKDLNSNAHLSEFWRVYSLLKWMEVFQVTIV